MDPIVKGIVHPKIDHVYEFVSSFEQTFSEMLHYMTCSPMNPLQWMGAVRMRFQTEMNIFLFRTVWDCSHLKTALELCIFSPKLIQDYIFTGVSNIIDQWGLKLKMSWWIYYKHAPFCFTRLCDVALRSLYQLLTAPIHCTRSIVNKCFNATSLQICSEEDTNSSTPRMAWGWVNHQYIFIFGWIIPLIKSLNHQWQILLSIYHCILLLYIKL